MGRASFSLEQATEFIRKTAGGEGTLAECALAWGKYCRARGYAVNLARLSRSPFAAEDKALGRWFARLWRAKPPRERHQGFWFGILEFAEGEQSFEDFYWGVATSAGLDTDASEWGWGKAALGSKRRTADSTILKHLWAEDSPVPKGEARHVFVLGYVALVAARLCLALPKAKRSVRRVVAAGYDEGDSVLLGALTDTGFGVAQETKQPPKPQRKLAAGELFCIERDVHRQKGWLLDSPVTRAGREVEYRFGTDARRRKPGPLTMGRYPGGGREMDFSFTVLDLPIVNRRVADIIAAHDTKSYQLLPITLNGSRERYWVLNVVAKVPPSHFKKWGQATRRPVALASIGKKAIARAGVVLRTLIVTRPLAEALIEAGVTGISLEPITREAVV